MSHCPEGHKCIWCGPKVAADRRDARGAQIDDWEEERAMAAVEEDEDDKLRVVAAGLMNPILGALKLVPYRFVMPIQERLVGLMIAGYAFTMRQTIDEAWVALRERAIAEQVYYEVNIKPELDAREKQKS